MDPETLEKTIAGIARAARDASRRTAELTRDRKDAWLRRAAERLEAARASILAANRADTAEAERAGLEPALVKRLSLEGGKWETMIAGLRDVAALPDPAGEITGMWVRPNGLRVGRMRIPLGVIAIIYESRPNVTVDAAALCLKAGNGVILRGGSEAIRSNVAIAAALQRALQAHGIPPAALTLVEDLRRETMVELLRLNDIVDLAIPRGGEGLIRFVAEHARVPVIKHYKGVCHLYVDASADPDLALDLLLDGKVARPSACNALETLLVHAEMAADFLPRAAAMLRERGVQLRADPRALAHMPGAVPATDDDWDAEFLDLVIAVRVVDSLDAAIDHIRRHGSDHTEVIATRDEAAAASFVHALRSAVVMVNASSRFSDGGELGLGAEIGISTTRLHAYGPMGAESLTIERFVVRGAGQTRNLRN